MKKYLLAILSIIVVYISYSQGILKSYNDFIEKGRSLYKAKDYKNAAITYRSAIKLAGYQTMLNDHNRAGFCWALAKYPDSAFYHLNIISNLKGLTFRDVDDIINDDDYIPIYNDARWAVVKNKMFVTAYQTLLSLQNKITGKRLKSSNNIGLAQALGNKKDSAFIHVNDEAYLFLNKKDYLKAYQLLKVSIKNFPPNIILNQNMGDYYLAIGDKDRAYVYYSRAELMKYKQVVNDSISIENIDIAITATYRNLSNKMASEIFPPEFLVSTVANMILKKGLMDKAYDLFRINIKNYPNSLTTNKEMGNIYQLKGDKQKADDYNTRSIIIQFELPDNFFHPSFDVLKYISSRHEKLTSSPGSKARPTENIINSLGIHFLSKNMFDKAELLFKMNLENYPQSFNAYRSMSNYYKIVNNKVKEEEFNSLAQTIKSNYGIEGTFLEGPISDTTYDVNVISPSCKANCPVILFDELHTGRFANGKYKSFINLMANDGFKISLAKTSITKQSLATTNVIVIVGGELNNAETKILIDWVRKGGSLLTIVDHDGSAGNDFLQSLGIQTQEISVTTDSLHAIIRDDFFIFRSYIWFAESDKSLGNHPIIKGRNNAEKINRVQTFAGRTIIGPAGSSVLLKLRESAVDYMSIDLSSRASRVPVKTRGLRSHGVAFTLGKGKVVVISESATLTAQLFGTGERGKIGMNTPGSDNKQFALNIMRWLTGYLK